MKDNIHTSTRTFFEERNLLLILKNPIDPMSILEEIRSVFEDVEGEFHNEEEVDN